MAWKGYRLIYRALSPVHVGSYTLGYINLTRRYITGRAMWGALTANLVRTGLVNMGYEACGEMLKTNVLMSYFFPALDIEKPFLPKYGELGLQYGFNGSQITSHQFEQKFIRSMGQTAIDIRTWTAEDQTLHDSEYLTPRVQDGESFKQLLFVGYLYVNDKNDNRITEEIIKKAWSELFIGGDRKYGWGRIKLIDIKEDTYLFHYPLDSDCNKVPTFKMSRNSPVPAHVLVNEGVKLKGDMELFSGLEYDNENKKGFGHKISKECKLCWTPGSVLIEDASLSIGPYGVMD